MVVDDQGSTSPSSDAPADSATTDGSEKQPKQRERATIAFAYGDLEDAVAMAAAIAGQFGSQCTLDQLAARLNHSNVASGGFRLKLSTARVFGLIDSERNADQVILTELGRRIVQPSLAAQARVTSFLAVPLYRAIYNRYKGYSLPPDIAMENEMIRLGVPTKQKDKARQAFQRSAEQAGFFAFGRDRLVLPAGTSESASVLEIPVLPSSKPISDPETDGGATARSRGPAAAGDGLSGLSPFIRGLVETLPPPGASWPIEKRTLWLETAERVFGLIYNE